MSLSPVDGEPLLGSLPGEMPSLSVLSKLSPGMVGRLESRCSVNRTTLLRFFDCRGCSVLPVTVLLLRVPSTHTLLPEQHMDRWSKPTAWHLHSSATELMHMHVRMYTTIPPLPPCSQTTCNIVHICTCTFTFCRVCHCFGRRCVHTSCITVRWGRGGSCTVLGHWL